MGGCRWPGGMLCQRPAFMEVLAGWRYKTRWLTTFDVDEYFYVPLRDKVYILLLF
jgi:hypothetical protein